MKLKDSEGEKTSEKITHDIYESITFNDIFDNSMEAIFIVRVENEKKFIFEKFNKAYEDITGIKGEEFEGRTPDETLPPDIAESVRTNYMKCLIKRKTIIYDEFVPVKSGKQYWETMLTPLFDKERRIMRIIGFGRNIDLRKELENEYKTNELRLESLLKISQYKAGTNQEFIDYALKQALLLTESKIGYMFFYDDSAKEFTLDTWSRSIMQKCTVRDPQTKYLLEKTGILGEAVKQRRPIIINNYQEFHPLKKGYPIGNAPLLKYLTIPVFIDDKIVAVVGVANKDIDYTDKDILNLSLFMDAVWRISEMKRTQESLIKAKDQLLDVQKLAKITRWGCNFETGELNFTDEILQLFNIEKPKGRVFLNDLMPYLKSDDSKRVMDAINSIIENQLPLDMEFQFMINGSNYSALYLKAVCEEVRDGKCAKVSGSVQDITSIKEIQQKNTVLQEQLYQSQKLEAMGQLAGGVAHDFNNMLAGIIGNAEILQMRLMDETENSKIVKKIITASEHAANLTKQLLSFSRKGKYQSIPVEVNKIVADVISMLEKTIDKKINIEQALDENNPVILGDPIQIENAVLNLAINARDAMSNGGALAFQTLSGGDNGSVQIIVKDTGSGMSDEVKKHLYEPFFTTKERGKGTGLGLAGVYGIVKNHKGVIKIESEVGKGTTVFLKFPKSKNVTVPNEIAEGASSKLGFGNIMIVDDETAIRDFTSMILLKYGYNTTAFKDGESAIEFFKKEHKTVNVVILDMIMPMMNGKEVFFELKKIDKNVKVIISSGFSQDGDASDLLEYPNVAFLQKPYRTATLLAKIEEVLSDK
jgi:PAS domain S-box-containing protein